MENLAPLASRLKPVVIKRAGLALALWGEAGIGKTHAAQGLLAAATCRGFSLHAAMPLAELVKALPRPSRLPLWALRPLEGLGRGEHATTSSSADALAALLAALAPVVLHLEDLHEAAPERQELWGALAERAKRSRGVALLATSRVLPPEPFEVRRIEPLSEEASGVLLEREIGAVLPREAASWIYHHAHGNPLFTLEYLRHLARQGYLWNDLRHWRWREPPGDLMPVTVEALIERTVEQAQVSEAAREALEVAAMLPVNAPLELWLKVTGLSEDRLKAAIGELEHGGLFKNEAFAHPLFREVTLNRLGGARRCELSRRALLALKDDPQAAAPFVEVAGLEPNVARVLLEEAAAQAEAAGNQVQAARLLARAVNYASGKEQGKLAFGAAQGLRHHDLAEATRLAELSVRLHSEHTEAHFFLAELYAQQGQLTEVDRVLAGISEDVKRDVAWLNRLTYLKSRANDSAGAVALWRNHADLREAADPVTMGTVASALLDLGETAEAETVIVQALAHPDLSAPEKTKLLSLLGHNRLYQADYHGALYAWSQAADSFSIQGNRFGTAAVLFNRTIALSYLAQFKEASADLERVLELFGDIGDSLSCAETQGRLGDMLVDLGKYAQAEETLLSSREILLRANPSGFLVDCECSLSRLYQAWQPAHGRVLALKYAMAALQRARQLTGARIITSALFYVSTAETWGGDAHRGLRLADEALELALRLDNPQRICRGHFARGLAQAALSKPKEALTALREAEAIAERIGLALEAHEIGLELDRLNGNVDSARARLAWFEERDLMHGVNIAKRYFPELAQRGEVAPAPIQGDAPRLELLGHTQVTHSGVPQSVRGQKRKELLVRLLEARIAGRSEVTLLELLDSLYPGEPEDAAAKSLKQLVFQLRKSLGTRAILRTTGGYALGNINSDAESFLKKGDTRLWRGVYLEDAGEGNETVSSALYHALRIKAAERLDADPVEAARLGRLLLQADPYDVEALRLTLKALRASDNHRALTRLYHDSRHHLAEVGERLPERWAEFLSQPAA